MVGDKILFLMLLLTSCVPNKVEVVGFRASCEASVLKKNTIGKEYMFSIPHEDIVEEYGITYIGQFTTSQNKVLYIEILSGNKISPHLDTYLALYTFDNVCLGYFYIGSTPQPQIKLDDLIFNNNYGDCDQITTINFKDSIPNEIFIKCKKDKDDGFFGDIYGFSKE